MSGRKRFVCDCGNNVKVKRTRVWLAPVSPKNTLDQIAQARIRSKPLTTVVTASKAVTL